MFNFELHYEQTARLWIHNLNYIFLSSRGSPTLVQALPGPSVQVTAGSNHTAVLLMDGQVFTFGSFSVRKTCTAEFFTSFFYMSGNDGSTVFI